jgi:hypothetical protein
MIKIFSNIIPFKGFLAMTVWPVVFIRKELREKYTATVDRHENIHAEQQKEVLMVAIVLTLATAAWTGSAWALMWLPLYFYIYFTEWLLRSIFSKENAYLDISFEKEAYIYEYDPDYLPQRIPFAWLFI